MFPYNGVIDLTKGPVSAVTALRYYDTAGVVQTIAPVNYVLDTNRRIARLVAAVGYSWPAVWFGYPGVVQVMYTAGYADATKVPKPIKQWILMCLAALYESREQVFIAKQRGQTVQVMPTANSLLERYLVEEIG
jgi:uncharacterized phiE125 gp8 family phage protein